jgi:hypothetical protein
MDCTDIKVLLSGLVDDQLDAETRYAAERHLADCRACRALVDDAEATSRLLASEAEMSASDDELPRGFEGAVLSRTVYENDGHGRGGPWINWLGWIAAAAALLLAVTIWVMDQRWLVPSRPTLVATPQNGSESASGETGATAVQYRPTAARSWTLDVSLPPDALGLAPLADELAVDDEMNAEEASPESAADEPVGVMARNEPKPEETAVEVESRRETQRITAPPSAMSWPRPQLSDVQSNALDTASLLLEMLVKADAGSFADVEHIRRIAEYEDLLDHLAATRAALPAEHRPALFATEGVLLRIVNGPLSLADVRALKRAVEQTELPGQLDDLVSAAANASM